jgi:hypothetical protein
MVRRTKNQNEEKYIPGILCHLILLCAFTRSEGECVAYADVQIYKRSIHANWCKPSGSKH